MKIEQPNYYAIIPASVRYCKSLSANAKLLYGEITALASTDRGCFARNSYFANLFDVDCRTIARWINQLEELGFISQDNTFDDLEQIFWNNLFLTTVISGYCFLNVFSRVLENFENRRLLI